MREKINSMLCRVVIIIINHINRQQSDDVDKLNMLIATLALEKVKMSDTNGLDDEMLESVIKTIGWSMSK